MPVGSQVCHPSTCPPLKKEVSQSLITEIAAHHTVQAHHATVISRSRTDKDDDKDDMDDPCQTTRMTRTTQPSLDNDDDNDDAARMVSKD